MKPFLEPILFWLRFKKIIQYVPKDGRVCDICCGKKGFFLFKIKDLIKEGVGYDKETETKTIGNISLKKAEIKNSIAEASDSFDCVTLLAALEHLSEPGKIVKECYEILRPSGVLLMTTPSPRGKWLLEFLAFKIGIVSPEQIRDHKHYFNFDELMDLLIKAGFRDDSVIIQKFELGFNFFVKARK